MTYLQRLLMNNRDERMTPSDTHALTVWLGMRSEVFRRALLETQEPPDMDTQIFMIDHTMNTVFSQALAEGMQNDMEYLMFACMQILKREWVSKRLGPDRVLAGSLPIPQYETPATRKSLDLVYLR